MAYFNYTKLERAVRSLIVNKIPVATWESTFLGEDSNIATLPCRKVVLTQFDPKVSWRPEGIAQFTIEHKFPAKDQPTSVKNTQRVNAQNYVGQTMDLLNMGGESDQALSQLAAAITYAGRWLAATDNTDQGNVIAQQNIDMLNFRCDWVKFGRPLITRGNAGGETAYWYEIIHLSAFVSHASN